MLKETHYSLNSYLGWAIQIFLLTLLVAILGSHTNGQTLTLIKKQERAEKVAINFIAKFRENLDFGIAFEEMASSNSIHQLRETGLLEYLNLNQDFSKKLDDATAKRFYIAFMNLMYLRGVYDLSVDPKAECQTKTGKPLNMEIQSFIKASPYYEWFSDDTVGGNLTPISTTSALEGYISALTGLANLYKKHLPANVFTTSRYKQYFGQFFDKQSRFPFS